jgi:hypothetical protein
VRSPNIRDCQSPHSPASASSRLRLFSATCVAGVLRRHHCVVITATCVAAVPASFLFHEGLTQSESSSRARGTAYEDNKDLFRSAQFLELQGNQIHSYRLMEELISTSEDFGGFGRSPITKRGQCA